MIGASTPTPGAVPLLREVLMRIVIVLALILTAAVAVAQDPCATAVPLVCGDAPVLYNVGHGGWLTPASACGDPLISCSATLFEVTLTAPTELTLNLSFPGSSGIPTLYVFEDCAGASCVDSFPATGGGSWSVCLPAGTFYVVMNEPTCLFYSYEIQATCQPCSDPVANEGMGWGSVKALFR